MPRQPRLDAPGALHHVIGRGIDGIKIFINKKDREDFLERLADLCRAAWCGCCVFRVVIKSVAFAEISGMNHI